MDRRFFFFFFLKAAFLGSDFRELHRKAKVLLTFQPNGSSGSD